LHCFRCRCGHGGKSYRAELCNDMPNAEVNKEISSGNIFLKGISKGR
jgi:hypothetical protein